MPKSSKPAASKPHAQNPTKIQVPSSPEFLEELDSVNEMLNENTRHNYKLKRSNVGRILFKMYMAVADEVPAEKIIDDETFKAALIEAIKKKG